MRQKLDVGVGKFDLYHLQFTLSFKRSCHLGIKSRESACFCHCIVVSAVSLVVCLVLTVLPAESDSDAMLSLQSYRGLRIDRPLVY